MFHFQITWNLTGCHYLYYLLYNKHTVFLHYKMASCSLDIYLLQWDPGGFFTSWHSGCGIGGGVRCCLHKRAFLFFLFILICPWCLTMSGIYQDNDNILEQFFCLDKEVSNKCSGFSWRGINTCLQFVYCVTFLFSNPTYPRPPVNQTVLSVAKAPGKPEWIHTVFFQSIASRFFNLQAQNSMDLPSSCFLPPRASHKVWKQQKKQYTKHTKNNNPNTDTHSF